MKKSFSGIDSREDIKREIKVLREDIQKPEDGVIVGELESRLSKLAEKFRSAA
jgi:hypothetical protein